MDKLKLLLVCGAGMSSGFLAQSCRKHAKKIGIEIQVNARSESEVSNYASDIDILLVGPHYKGAVPEFERILKPYGVPCVIIPDNVYSGLDGEGLLALALETLKK